MVCDVMRITAVSYTPHTKAGRHVQCGGAVAQLEGGKRKQKAVLDMLQNPADKLSKLDDVMVTVVAQHLVGAAQKPSAEPKETFGKVRRARMLPLKLDVLQDLQCCKWGPNLDYQCDPSPG